MNLTRSPRRARSLNLTQRTQRARRLCPRCQTPPRSSATSDSPARTVTAKRTQSPRQMATKSSRCSRTGKPSKSFDRSRGSRGNPASAARSAIRTSFSPVSGPTARPRPSSSSAESTVRRRERDSTSNCRTSDGRAAFPTSPPARFWRNWTPGPPPTARRSSPSRSRAPTSSDRPSGTAARSPASRSSSTETATSGASSGRRTRRPSRTRTTSFPERPSSFPPRRAPAPAARGPCGGPFSVSVGPFHFCQKVLAGARGNG